MAETKQVNAGTKLESIGTVKTVVGEVKAVDAAGNERILQAGDKVFANETIVTANGGMVLIEFADGTHLDLASASKIVLDTDVFNPANAATTPEGKELTAEQIQEMIARGEDPTAVTEATAAGAGAGDEGGSSFVTVDFNNTQGNVTSGFGTLGIPGPESTTFTELPPVEDDAVATPPTVIIGSLLEIELDVEAQGIPEGSDVVYTVTLDKASTGDITITLSNGAVIVIPAGQVTGSSDPIAVQGDDPYVDPSQEAVNIVSMTGGGANEVLQFDPTPVDINVIDTIDTTTVTLNDVTVAEDGTITYTASVDNAPQGAFSVTLNNGVVINFASGSLTGSSDPQLAQGDDPYLDGESFVVSIASTSGGNYEALDTTDTATVTIEDTIDTTTVTLNDVTVTEGGSFVYTASVNNAPQGSNLVITLSNGVSITIIAGQTSATSTSQVAPNAPDGGSTSTISITTATGGNYEALDTTDTLVLTVNDTAPTPANDSYTVVEGSTLTVNAANGVLTNDVDGYDGGKTAVAGTLTGSLGGSLILAADGSFSYVAPVRDHSDAVADSETFTYTMKDADGTERTATITIGITDTVPTITATTNAVVDNEAGLQVTGTVTATAVDGVDHFDLSSSVAPSGLTYTFSTDGSFLTAKDGTGETVFTLSVNPDGTYEYTLVKAAPETVAVTPDFDTLNVPNHATSYALTLYGSYTSGGVGIGDPVGTVTFSTATDYLSVSQDGLGVQNNLMNTGEALRMTFDSPVSDATLNIGNFSKGDILKWTVYDADGTTVLDSGTITVTSNSESLDFAFKLSDYGLDANTSFTSLTIESTANSYKFTGFSIEKAVTVDDTTYDFNVVAVDGDGDTSNTGSLSVTVNGTDDTLMGTTSNDVINGGTGDDILTGLGGADAFVWNSGDTGHDTVTDFNVGEEDVLNVADLLSGGLTMTAVAESGHLQLQFSDGSNTVQTIDLTNIAVSDNTAAQTMLTNLLNTNHIVD